LSGQVEQFLLYLERGVSLLNTQVSYLELRANALSDSARQIWTLDNFNSCIATFSGAVKSTLGVGIVGVPVTVTDHLTGVVLVSTTTTSGGAYSGSLSVPSLPGAYVDINATYGGVTHSQINVLLSCGSNTIADITFAVPQTFNFTATKCGAANYSGVAVVVSLGGTVVVSGSTNGSGLYTTTLSPGSYTYTATDPAGIVFSGSFTIGSSTVNTSHQYLTPLATSVADTCGNPISGSVVTWAQTGGGSWTGTTSGGGFATATPTVDLTGSRVTVSATFGGATSPSFVVASGSLSNLCSVPGFGFGRTVSGNVYGCSVAGTPVPITGANFSATGPAGETGTATTNSLGAFTANWSPPISNLSGTCSYTITKSKFTTLSGTFGSGSCGLGAFDMVPDASHVCFCDDCSDGIPVSSTWTISYSGGSNSGATGSNLNVDFTWANCCGFVDCPPGPGLKIWASPVSGTSFALISASCSTGSITFGYTVGTSVGQCNNPTTHLDTPMLRQHTGLDATCDSTGVIKTKTFPLTFTGSCSGGSASYTSSTVPSSFVDSFSGITVPLPGGNVTFSI
jgi:hypothetical protein